MIRLLSLALVLSAATLIDVEPAQAISRNNPYRSFNLTGVNYASMQWEKSHRGNAKSSSHGRGLFQRRR